MMLSPKQELYYLILDAFGEGMEQEHRFHPERKWRLDFAWPEQMIALEYEGIYNARKSRHTTVAGYTGDCEKYNAAQALGWKVYRITAKLMRTPGYVHNLLEMELHPKNNFVENKDD